MSIDTLAQKSSYKYSMVALTYFLLNILLILGNSDIILHKTS